MEPVVDTLETIIDFADTALGDLMERIAAVVIVPIMLFVKKAVRNTTWGENFPLEILTALLAVGVALALRSSMSPELTILQTIDLGFRSLGFATLGYGALRLVRSNPKS